MRYQTFKGHYNLCIEGVKTLVNAFRGTALNYFFLALLDIDGSIAV
jgi:hypothetical protein